METFKIVIQVVIIVGLLTTSGALQTMVYVMNHCEGDHKLELLGKTYTCIPNTKEQRRTEQ